MTAGLPGSIGYRELADLLRAEIEAGRLRPGDRLPSERSLTQEHGVSYTTARAAIRLLRTEGLVEVRHGYPTRVREEPDRTPVRIQRGASFVIRPATSSERAEHGLHPGDRVVEIHYGAKVLVYPAERHRFSTT